MPAGETRTRLYRFGPFELDSETGELRKNGFRIRLGEQSCRVLTALLQRPGELVTREELQRQLWSDGTSVDFDHGLNVVVGRVRLALADTAEHPRYIETVPRKGYRFLSSVEPAAVAAQAPDIEQPTQETPTQTRLATRGRKLAGALIAGLLAGLAAAAFWLYQRNDRPSFVFATVLTGYAGAQRCPSFSPDGGRIAFSWAGDKQDNLDIYVKNIGSDAPARLTTDPRPDLSPAWSPDGSSVGFIRLSGPDTAEVLLMPTRSSGPERRLATFAAPSALFRDLRLLAWSGDGRWLVVSGRQSTMAPAELVLLSTETGERRTLVPASRGFEDLEPAFSPDMSRIAFVRHSGANSGDLFLLHLTPDLRAQGEPERLTFDNLLIGSPVWTRDGRGIVFTRYATAGKPSIWKMTPGHGRPEPLPISADNALGLAISAKGDRLVYTRETTNSSIWTMDRAAQGERLLIGSSGREFAPSYSPDGERIAFESSRSGWSEIWIADRDGSHPRQITHLKGSVASFPRWSPDGRRIVFHSRQKIYATLYIAEIATGSVREMNYDAVNDTAPSWSRDGKWIYFASQRTQALQIWKVPAEGGRAVQVTTRGGFAPLESPDGRFVLYTRQGYGIWRLPVSGGEEQQIIPDTVAGAGSAYAPVSGGVYFVRDQATGKEEELVFFGYGSGRYTRVAGIARPVYLGFAISPSDGRFVYTVIDHSSCELMLVQNFR
jgi:Tol biopolymer transport system component